MFGWLRNRRRKKLLAQPFPGKWLDVLQSNVWQYDTLTSAEKVRLRDDLRVFIAEKNWEGCGGLEMTDEVKVTVAAYACLMILGLDLDCYDRIVSILVYPDEFVAPETKVIAGGLYVDQESDRMGEAWHGGPVVLSWADALAAGRRETGGVNVILHEFAHQLDLLSSAISTVPFMRGGKFQEWHELIRKEYDRLVRASDQGRATLLDDYGATDMAEFFAVATECFFEKPVQLRRTHRALYTMFSKYYRQDPAARMIEAGRAG